MKNLSVIITASIALLTFGACQQQEMPTDIGHPLQEVNFSEPQLQNGNTAEVNSEVTVTPPKIATQSSSEEKVTPAEPQKDLTQSESTSAEADTVASTDDRAIADEAYKTGDITLCDKIIDSSLKQICTQNLSPKATEPKEEAVSIVTPGTPQ